MTSLRDVMAKDPVMVAPDATVAEAAATMVARRIGSVLVREGPASLGILTERDVLRAAGAEGSLLATRVREWMTRDPTTAPAEQDVGEAADTMLAGGFRHLPVTEDDELVGIVSVRTLLAAVRGARPEPGAAGTSDADPAPSDSPAGVQARRTQMHEATRLLQRRARAVDDDAERWRAELADATQVLDDVLRRHVAETEGPDGFLAEVVRESEGRLASAARRLGHEHVRARALLDELREAIAGGGDDSVPRQLADELAAQLEAHRHRGSDLLWRAHVAELGGSD